MSVTREYVVEFGTCGEAVVRRGESPEAVSFADDLGCPPTRVRPLAEARLKTAPWMKNGELRCELAD